MTKRTYSEIGKSNVRRSKAHERRVAKLLTKWSGSEFRRRRVEGREESTIARESTSDVISVNRIFKFSVEAKCGKDFSFDALLASPQTARFTEWWFQTSYDAGLLTTYLTKTDKSATIMPMLFFKPEPSFDWVAFPIAAFGFLRIQNEDIKPNIRLWQLQHLNALLYYYHEPIKGNTSHSKKNPVYVEKELPPVAICRWRDFETKIDPSTCFHS
jgi:hypothetical protein